MNTLHPLAEAAKKVEELFFKAPKEAAVLAAKTVGLSSNGTIADLEELLAKVSTAPGATHASKSNGPILLAVAALCLKGGIIEAAQLCFRKSPASTLSLSAMLSALDLRPGSVKQTLSANTDGTVQRVALALDSYDRFISVRKAIM